MSDYVQQQHTICNFSNEESWVILSPIEQSIKQKIESVGTPLKDWDIKIYRGVLTGYNDAFIISTEKRNEILANCQTEDERLRTAELIRPILRGRDIKRYGYDWAGLYLIYIPWHFPLQFDTTITGASEKAENAFKEQYPAVYTHMLQYKDSLSKRNKAETGIRYEWYAMQRWGAKYWDDFFKPKICWASVGETLYSLIPEGYLLLDTNYFFSIDEPRYLLIVLNSKLITWWINSEDTPIGSGGAFRHYKYNLEKICIPKFMPNLQTLDLEDFSLKNEFDKQIYLHYGLSEDEIKFIENQFV